MSNLPAPAIPANPSPEPPTTPNGSPPGSVSHPIRPTVVVAHGVTHCFDDHQVICGLDLDIEPGSIVGLIGPSGCGKTTTVRLLTGLLSPTSGIATVFGQPATDLNASDRSRIGYLPQSPALFPELSLDENLSFHASMYGLPFRRRERLTQLLEWVELDRDRRKRVADASGGMRRRLALAAAFVHDPDVVFLDEPTAGIDPILREKLWDRFRGSAANGKTLVVTTQYVGEAGQCDLVGLLSEGELLLIDTPAALRRAAYDGDVVDVRLERPLADDELRRLAQVPIVSEVERAGPVGLRIVVDDATRAVGELGAGFTESGVAVATMEEHVVDYDEAFVRIVERHRDEQDRQSDGAAA